MRRRVAWLRRVDGVEWVCRYDAAIPLYTFDFGRLPFGGFCVASVLLRPIVNRVSIYFWKADSLVVGLRRWCHETENKLPWRHRGGERVAMVIEQVWVRGVIYRCCGVCNPIPKSQGATYKHRIFYQISNMKFYFYQCINIYWDGPRFGFGKWFWNRNSAL